MISTIGIVGAGAWGTALAQTESQKHDQIKIWAYEEETAQDINHNRVNSQFLPDVPLASNIICSNKISDLADCDVLILVPPAQTVRAMSAQLKDCLPETVPLVLCSKGIEQSSGLLLSEIINETMPLHQLAVLSGPSFAFEVARGQPTAVTLACEDSKIGHHLVETLGHKGFRPYYSPDVLGAEIGGAVKNVLAIAAGIVAGKQLGAGAHAALITRGFHEMARLGAAVGGKAETLRGLSGLGDLVLTCSNTLSRNMSLGVALGEGQLLNEIMGQRNSVTEGVFTAGAVVELAEKKGIEMPICAAVNAIVKNQINVDEAIEGLLSRPFKDELV